MSSSEAEFAASGQIKAMFIYICSAKRCKLVPLETQFPIKLARLDWKISEAGCKRPARSSSKKNSFVDCDKVILKIFRSWHMLEEWTTFFERCNFCESFRMRRSCLLNELNEWKTTRYISKETVWWESLYDKVKLQKLEKLIVGN